MENTPKMKLEIYKNKELVNTIISDYEARVYKELATVLFAKEHKRATKTTIDYLNNTMKITQTFDKTKTQLENTTYTYKYVFENVCL